MITRTQLSRSTREKLAAQRSSRREAHDELLRKLSVLVPKGDGEGVYADAFRTGLLNARLDLRTARVFSRVQVKRQLIL